MHPLIENYLTDLIACLGLLPIARRNEELREIRQHIQNTVTVNREFGQTEDAAVASAIEQFGEPQEIASQIILAWRRGETLNRRSLWTSVLATPIILGSLLYLLCSCEILERVWPSFNGFFSRHPEQGRMVVHGSFFMVFALTGLIIGLTFSKQAVRGVCFGLAVYTIIWLGQTGWRFDIPTQPGQFMAYGENIAWYLTAMFSAWAISRWRTRKARRAGAIRLAILSMPPGSAR